MRRLLYALTVAMVALFSSAGQVAHSQAITATSTLQSGFAVITPVTGNTSTLNVSETFTQQTDGTVVQTSVLPSPIVNLTNVLVNLNSTFGVNTGIAMVNPNNVTTTVVLSLTNDQGALVATTPITMAPHQQISAFVTDFFAGAPSVPAAMTGALFIQSDLGIGVLGIEFNGTSFSALPVAAQLSTTGSTVNIVAAVNLGNAVVPANTIASATIVSPPTSTVSSITPSPGLGVIPSVSGAVLNPSPTLSTFNATTITGATLTGPPPVNNFTGTFTTVPQVAPIGGTGALLLAQVAVGGGWSTQITIANTAISAQIVRVDLLTPGGQPMTLPGGSTFPSVVVPAGGFVVLDIRG